MLWCYKWWSTLKIIIFKYFIPNLTQTLVIYYASCFKSPENVHNCLKTNQLTKNSCVKLHETKYQLKSTKIKIKYCNLKLRFDEIFCAKFWVT